MIFEGEDIEGSEYYLVDDFVGQGGTPANLRGFIEQSDGRNSHPRDHFNRSAPICYTGHVSGDPGKIKGKAWRP